MGFYAPAQLVRDAREHGRPVHPRTVAANLEVAVGNRADHFHFATCGNLSQELVVDCTSGPGRRKLFEQHLESEMTLIVFESPHRVQKALQDLVATFGPDRAIAIGRELTKHFEEVFRGTTSAAQAHFIQHPPRGEFTIVLGGRSAPITGADKAR